MTLETSQDLSWRQNLNIALEKIDRLSLYSDGGKECMGPKMDAFSDHHCIAVKRFLPLGFPVQTNTDR
jgi:hypothetical protein